MRALLAMTVILVSGAGMAAELPAFERDGYPITAHQVSVLGGTDVRERAPMPALTAAGMPASPHQVAVLTPRPRMTEQQISASLEEISASLKRSGFSQVRFLPPVNYTVMGFLDGAWNRLTIDGSTGQLRSGR
jgi:hypothetical protein